MQKGACISNNMAVKLFLVAVCLLLSVAYCSAIEWDSSGYILYCPCMGRFGNQVAHFLGALQFAKDLDRTLALPPFRTYRNVPFKEWFKPGVVGNYHKSIEMEEFLSEFSDSQWSADNRIGYCYGTRNTGSSQDCEMKNGNPFGPFWDGLEVNFTSSVQTNLGYDTNIPSILKQWKERFPPTTHPVLAFKGAPASFPVKKRNRHLQEYLVWSDTLIDKAKQFIQDTMNGEKFIAVHLRIGKDWESACKNANGQRSFMESLMCLEDFPEDAKITNSICFPTSEEIVNDIYTVIRWTGISNVFIGSDSKPPLELLRKEFGNKVKVHHMNPHGPQLDVVMFELSNHFIANCVSSLSAIAVRARNIANKPTSFFGLINSKEHDEL